MRKMEKAEAHQGRMRAAYVLYQPSLVMSMKFGMRMASKGMRQEGDAALAGLDRDLAGV